MENQVIYRIVSDLSALVTNDGIFILQKQALHLILHLNTLWYCTLIKLFLKYLFNFYAIIQYLNLQVICFTKMLFKCVIYAFLNLYMLLTELASMKFVDVNNFISLGFISVAFGLMKLMKLTGIVC